MIVAPGLKRALAWFTCSLKKRRWLCWWDIKKQHLFLNANWRKLLVFVLIRAVLPCSSLWKWSISQGVIGHKVCAQRGNPRGLVFQQHSWLLLQTFPPLSSLWAALFLPHVSTWNRSIHLQSCLQRVLCALTALRLLVWYIWQLLPPPEQQRVRRK